MAKTFYKLTKFTIYLILSCLILTSCVNDSSYIKEKFSAYKSKESFHKLLINALSTYRQHINYTSKLPTGLTGYYNYKGSQIYVEISLTSEQSITHMSLTSYTEKQMPRELHEDFVDMLISHIETYFIKIGDVYLVKDIGEIDKLYNQAYEYYQNKQYRSAYKLYKRVLQANQYNTPAKIWLLVTIDKLIANKDYQFADVYMADLESIYPIKDIAKLEKQYQQTYSTEKPIIENLLKQKNVYIKISALEREVQAIPPSEFHKNYDIYNKLVTLDPGNTKYLTKQKYYSDRLKEQIREQAQKEKNDKTEELMERLQSTPENNFVEKKSIYADLIKLNPDNDDFKTKLNYYKEQVFADEKIKAQEEQKEKKLERDEVNDRDPYIDKMGEKPKNSVWDGSVDLVKEYIQANAENTFSLVFEIWGNVEQGKEGWEVWCQYRTKNSTGEYYRKKETFIIRQSKVISSF